MEAPPTEEQIVQALNSKRLELTIFPTEKCNFRCTYCYEDFAIGRMSNETISSVKKLLQSRSRDLDELHISWFGGEPLVAKDIVKDIQSYALELSNVNEFHLTGGMSTNGFLLDKETITSLVRCKVTEFQISLDGDPVDHDCSRLLKGGGPTFDQIWKNLISIRDSDLACHILLRIHFTPSNFDRVLAFSKEISNEFSSDDRFTFFPKAIVPLGGENDGLIEKVSSTNQRKMAEQIIAAINGNTIKTIFDRKSCYICYAAKSNAFTIRATGEVGKCTVALSDPANNVGRITTDGSIVINDEKHRPWLKGIFSQSPADLGCPLSTLKR